jgi:oxygen-dependent protoporphyrinogen oxidase
MNTDIVVIGGGLSGLVAAYTLHRAGRAVVVLEAAHRAGGVIGTVERDGVLIERGPNTAMDLSDAVAPLLEQLGIAAERVNASDVAARRYLVHHGRLQALPSSLGGFIATPLFSARGKLRLMREPWAPPAPAGGDESVAEFVRRRLGSEALDVGVEPFVSGIYAGDPEALSLAATFPRLQALEARGGLVRGAIAMARERRRSGATRRKPVSFSFRRGLQTLTDALAAALPTLHCARPAVRLERDAAGFRVHDAKGASVTARELVLALPVHATAALVAPLVPAAAAALEGVDSASLAVVATVHRRADVAHPLDGFGFLVPRREPVRVLGTLFSSSMFSGRVPEGRVLLTSFLGGRRHAADATLPEGDLLALVARDHAALLSVRAAPLDAEIVRWPRALPQPDRGHGERLAALAAAEQALPGLIVGGSFRSGVSISDCIDGGVALAARVLARNGRRD